MKNLNKIIGLLLIVMGLASCQEDNYNIGDIIAPSNIVVTTQIVGQDADNPYGDGTGEIIFLQVRITL